MIHPKRSLPTGGVRLVVLVLALSASTLGILAVPAIAAIDDPAAGAPAFLLHEGVLVAPGEATLYVMQPTGSLGALGLDGAVRWSTDLARRPLGLSGDRVIAQADAGGDLVLVGLDVASGDLVGRAEIGLPDGVFARIDDDVRGSFDLAVHETGGDLQLHWKSVERAVQAYLPGIEESLVPGDTANSEVARAAATKGVRATEGAFVLDVATLEKRAGAPTKALAGTPGPSLNELAADRAIPGIPNEGRRFLSVDGAHVLVSERVSIGLEPVYRWSVYSRLGERLGEIESNVSAAPFAVAGGQLFFVSRAAVGPNSESADVLLRAFDLASGAEQWKTGVDDTAFQGPFPP